MFKFFARTTSRFTYTTASKQPLTLDKLVDPSKRKYIGGWLLLTGCGVFSMILVGGYTRLTHSGLSIVDWSPYTKKYPATPEGWDVEFEKYKNSIEYKTVNNRMSLPDFKRIYTVEYVHRKIGVYLGYLFGFPFAYFAIRGYIKPTLFKRLLALLGLGGLQGFIGWWMVKSGIHEKPDYQSRPRVSPYRLSVHLMMATFLYSGLMWNAMSVLINPLTNVTGAAELAAIKRSRFIGLILLKCILINIYSGALVAGIDAGKVYNTWPLMNDKIMPEEAKKITGWRSFFENRALVQFNHRNAAYLTLSVGSWLAFHTFKNWALLPTRVRGAGALVFLIINYQVMQNTNLFLIVGCKRNPDSAEPGASGNGKPAPDDCHHDFNISTSVNVCVSSPGAPTPVTQKI